MIKQCPGLRGEPQLTDRKRKAVDCTCTNTWPWAGALWSHSELHVQGCHEFYQQSYTHCVPADTGRLQKCQAARKWREGNRSRPSWTRSLTCSLVSNPHLELDAIQGQKPRQGERKKSHALVRLARSYFHLAWWKREENCRCQRKVFKEPSEQRIGKAPAGGVWGSERDGNNEGSCGGRSRQRICLDDLGDKGDGKVFIEASRVGEGIFKIEVARTRLLCLCLCHWVIATISPSVKLR